MGPSSLSPLQPSAASLFPSSFLKQQQEQAQPQVKQQPLPLPPPQQLTRTQQMARLLYDMSEEERQLFVKEFDQEAEQRERQQQQQAAAATQPAVKQESKEQREAEHTQQPVATPFHLWPSRLPSTAASAPSSGLFAASPLANMLDPTSQLGLASFFKLLDIDKARNAPKLQSPQQFLQWRGLFAAFLQMHDSLQVTESGSLYLSLPVDVSAQASRSAALPLIQQGVAIGPPGHEQDRKLDHHRLIFAHTALTNAVEGVPLAFQAVTSVPMPNAQEAWKRLEKVMLPRTLGDRLIKEQEFMQVQQFNSESIAAYAARVQQLVTQLASLGSQQQEESFLLISHMSSRSKSSTSWRI